MDKGQLDCDISNSFCFIKTGNIVNMKLLFKLQGIRTLLKTNKHNFNLENMKLLSLEPTFPSIHYASATSTAQAYPVTV